ncbi:MAG TPA: DUF6665 family protein [Nevskia sp.]|jgi:hypothetical protein|nr:DUF6665 family protein [Nevskia sp.]
MRGSRPEETPPDAPWRPLDEQLRREQAEAMGVAGRRLRQALDALAAFDRGGVRGEREPLLGAAAEALRNYSIQKELLGAADDALVTRVYGVPPEVWRATGLIRRRSGR